MSSSSYAFRRRILAPTWSERAADALRRFALPTMAVSGTVGYCCFGWYRWSRFDAGELDDTFPSGTGANAGLLRCVFSDGAALREPHTLRPALGNIKETKSVDVCVIGGGVAGLMVGLAAVEAGLSCAVLDARRLGSGASGRCAGVLHETARGNAAIVSAVKRYDIDCGVPKSSATPSASFLNPLGLVFGLARAVEHGRAGVTTPPKTTSAVRRKPKTTRGKGLLFENTTVTKVTKTTSSPHDGFQEVHTAEGGLLYARDVVVATGAAPYAVSSPLAACTSPAASTVAVSTALPADVAKEMETALPTHAKPGQGVVRMVDGNRLLIALSDRAGIPSPKPSESGKAAVQRRCTAELVRAGVPPSTAAGAFHVDHFWQAQWHLWSAGGAEADCGLVGRDAPSGLWYSLGHPSLGSAAESGAVVVDAILKEREASVHTMRRSSPERRSPKQSIPISPQEEAAQPNSMVLCRPSSDQGAAVLPSVLAAQAWCGGSVPPGVVPLGGSLFGPIQVGLRNLFSSA